MPGLGACTAMTLRSYVQRHNWGLLRTTIELQHEKIPIADGASMIDHFHRTIHLDGDLTDEQRFRLLEIAERCPVTSAELVQREGDLHRRVDPVLPRSVEG